MARIEPLPPRQWAEEMKAALAAMRPAEARHPFPSSEGRPKALNWLGTMAHHPELTRAFNTFAGYILASSSLNPRQRELLALRVAAVRDCEYEWAQHALRADDYGFAPSDVSRIAEGPDAPGWSTLERAMLRAVDELIGRGSIAQTTWDRLAEDFEEQQLMDLVFTVGAYDTLALAMASFGLELDDDLKS